MKAFERSLRRLGAGGRAARFTAPEPRAAKGREAAGFSSEAVLPAAEEGFGETERLSERLERDSRRYPAAL